MPNHITNIITSDRMDIVKEKLCTIITEENEKQVWGTIGEESVDFNKLIPVPESMFLPEGGCASWELNKYNFPNARMLESYQKNTLEPLFERIYTNDLECFLFSAVVEVRTRCSTSFKEFYRIGENDNLNTEIRRVAQSYYNLKNYGSPDWYDWRIEHWGTKWNAYECNIGEDYIEFDTAWACPFEVIEELSKYATITVAWADEDLGGRNFGCRTYKDGKIIKEPIDSSYSKNICENIGCGYAIKGYDIDNLDEDYSDDNYSEEELIENFEVSSRNEALDIMKKSYEDTTEVLNEYGLK